MPTSGLIATIAATLVLATAAVMDQVGGRALVEHATTMYAPHGKEVSAGLLYGLLHGIAVTNLVLWLLVLLTARAGSRWATPFAVVTALIGAALAGTLLGAREYGESVFPTLWGLLALLTPLAGALAVTQLFRTRRAAP